MKWWNELTPVDKTAVVLVTGALVCLAGTIIFLALVGFK